MSFLVLVSGFWYRIDINFSFDIQVEAINNSDRSSKTEMAFKLFDMNKDGYITREEFKKVGYK